MKSILDPSFRYTSSLDTDLRKTFERIWRELNKRPKTTPSSDVGRSKLECKGERADIGAADGSDVVDPERSIHVCPHCDRRRSPVTGVPWGSPGNGM